jgi:hypothetical protein
MQTGASAERMRVDVREAHGGSRRMLATARSRRFGEEDQEFKESALPGYSRTPRRAALDAGGDAVAVTARILIPDIG